MVMLAFKGWEGALTDSVLVEAFAPTVSVEMREGEGE